MSAIDNAEVSNASDTKTDETGLSQVFKPNPAGRETYRIRHPKRILHFSDGTLEEDSTEESEPEDSDLVEVPLKSVTEQPAICTKTMPWSTWLYHHTTSTGHKTLNVLDSIGENIAYYLGITTPKYQYEIDEYNRMKEEREAKKRERDIELTSWATTSTSPKPNAFQPIVSEVVSQPDSLQ